MPERKLGIRRAAVLGAGVMGAQIAAHFTAAGIPVYLFDLPSDNADRSKLARQGMQRLLKLKPAPLVDAGLAGLITPMNFADDLKQLCQCDLVIEAVAERMDIKRELYDNIAPYIHDNALFASNTSGLSITKLASELPEPLAQRFCGVHFFNPPRYMHLVELIPHAGVDKNIVDQLEDFLTRDLGKGVVHARDTINFIANRIGVFTILSTIHHARRLELGLDTVDALTGPALGRPKSATFRLADVVGLDTMASVIETMRDHLDDDPWHAWFNVPDWFARLVESNALGQKTGAGIFRKEGKTICVIDPHSGEYRNSDYSLPEEVRQVLAIRDPAEKMAALARAENRHTEFVWSILRDLFHYCAFHLADIADSAREIDLAMRFGYGWQAGPFETWQAAGWKEVAKLIEKDIASGKTGVDAALPGWVSTIESAHSENGSWAADRKEYLARPQLPVYQRQYQPVRLLGEQRDTGTTVHENDSVRLWTLDKRVLIASIKSKMAVIDDGVIKGLQKAVELAENDHDGLIIWQPRGPFSAGANLKAAADAIERGDMDSVRRLIADFQAFNLRLRYSMVPTVAAMRGLALGGGLELAMHASARVAHVESYMGLVEAGVGLVPAGGGLATLAMQIVDDTLAGDSYPLLEKRYKQVAMGQVSGSAPEARSMGYLRPDDRIVMHEHELLHAAHHEIFAMQAAGYHPPVSGQSFPAAGDVGIATLRSLLVNMLEGHFISEHDEEIGRRIADALCGGHIDRGAPVTEEWIHQLERDHFMALAATEKTQQRIAHMLKTGKPLRN